MIVDIGPRQSGKTTRLLESVGRFLEENPNRTALLVAPNNGLRKLLKNKMEHICGDCRHRVITSHKMLPPTPNQTMRQFVDEFGCMKDENLVLDEDAYYCSSYNPDFNPWPQPTESMEGYSTMARQIVDHYNWSTTDRWDLTPKKKMFKHDF